MSIDCASASDPGTRPRQDVTSLTPKWVQNGVRMEDASTIVRTKLGAQILALADGHTSRELAPGLLVGARECANAAIEAAREYSDRLVEDAATVFGLANEAIRTQVRLDLPGVATFRPADPDQRSSKCSLKIRGRPQAPPFHGTTLTTVALFARYRVVVAFVGDSRVLFVSKRTGLPQWLNTTHTKQNSAEDARVRAQGATTVQRSEVMQAKIPVPRPPHRYDYRVDEHSFKCRLTRTLGGFGVEALLPDPEVVDTTLEEGVLLVGTRGFWETIDVDAVSDACSVGRTAQEICDLCMTACRKTSTRPNCTVLCSILKGEEKPSTCGCVKAREREVSKTVEQGKRAVATTAAVVQEGVEEAVAETVVAAAKATKAFETGEVVDVAEHSDVETACRMTCSLM